MAPSPGSFHAQTSKGERTRSPLGSYSLTLLLLPAAPGCSVCPFRLLMHTARGLWHPTNPPEVTRQISPWSCLQDMDLVPSHVVPSLTIDAEHNDVYSAYNKPGAVMYWLQVRCMLSANQKAHEQKQHTCMRTAALLYPLSTGIWVRRAVVQKSMQALYG